MEKQETENGNGRRKRMAETDRSHMHQRLASEFSVWIKHQGLAGMLWKETHNLFTHAPVVIKKFDCWLNNKSAFFIEMDYMGMV